MAIVHWEPLHDLLATQQHFNKLFRDTFSRVGGEEDLAARAWAPAVDIYETDQSLVLRAELPGINPNDVEVRVEDDTLYLKGERKFDKEVKDGNYHRVERAYGMFTRSFALPGSIRSEPCCCGIQRRLADSHHAQARGNKTQDDQN